MFVYYITVFDFESNQMSNPVYAGPWLNHMIRNYEWHKHLWKCWDSEADTTFAGYRLKKQFSGDGFLEKHVYMMPAPRMLYQTTLEFPVSTSSNDISIFAKFGVNFRAPLRTRLWSLGGGRRWWWSWCYRWVSGDMEERQGWCNSVKIIVWREYDKNIVFIWFNGPKKLSYGRKGFPIPMVNAV